MTGVELSFEMSRITIGVLTISDRCANDEAADESGSNLIGMIEAGIIRNGVLVKSHLVPDSKEDIEEVLVRWCDVENINLILTTGGTGLSERDVTPEATAAVLEKTVPGISNLMFKHSSAVTPLAALSRAIAGVRGKSLIINLPGSKKASKECLEAVAGVIPHAVDLITDKKKEVERVHGELGRSKKSVVADRHFCFYEEPRYPCIMVEAAQEIIANRIHTIQKKKIVGYEQALDHVLAQEIFAQDDHPPFNCSLKDGYAVVSGDESNDRSLIGVCNMGEYLPGVRIVPGSCMKVSTGGFIPPGADAVIEVENTELLPPDNIREERKVRLKVFPKLNENVREMGSAFKKGKLLMPTGTYLDSAGVGLLAAAGVTSVVVFCKPVVAVMSTGNELCHPHEDLRPGKVRDSNRITLISLLKENNFETVDLGITRDDPDSLMRSLEKGFREADVVVTTGSMSMGERDYLKEVIVADFGGEICFGRVLIKPGKPTAFGVVSFEGKPKAWFGLPGNPASAVVGAHLFLLPGLRKMCRRSEVFPLKVSVKAVGTLPGEIERPQYLRCRLRRENGELVAVPLDQQESCWIGNCVNANCVFYGWNSENIGTGILIGKY